MFFLCINIRWVQWGMLKTSGCAFGFQHLPQNPTNVNAWKNMFDPYIVNSSPVQSTGRAIVLTLASAFAFALALTFPSRHF